MRPIRWSHEDQYWKIFTYAKSKYFKPMALVLVSADEEREGCYLRASALGHTVIIALPEIIKPYRERVKATYWSTETIERLGRDWYEEIHPREYGLSSHQGFFQCFYGPQTHSSLTTKSWSTHLPWREWRHVRHSLYDLDGVEFWTDQDNKHNIKDLMAAEKACPADVFAFDDYDGERITATTRIEEREWRFGDGWCKWLSWFRSPKIKRSLNIDFSAEVGPEKGSWKGGTLGHSIEMGLDETHEEAFKRYCDEHRMTFVGLVTGFWGLEEK